MNKAILTSACLLGFPCRYDGTSRPCPPLQRLYVNGLAIPICPESLSGLPIPRLPCERVGQRILSRDGKDVTRAIYYGAYAALALAMTYPCRRAILKSRSPSCGTRQIYDGSFTGQLVPGNGVFAQLLLDTGWQVESEEDFLENLEKSPQKD